VNPIDALTAGAAALQYWERRQQVVTNNLANVDTAGFKAERVFGELLANGTTVAGAGTDMTSGPLTPTGNALDLAMGNGDFFVVNTPQGERLSRGGAFHLDAGGYVVDAAGHQLLGTHGPIRVLGGTVSVDDTGVVSDSGQPLDQLRVQSVPPGTALQHDAGTLFVPPATSAAVPPAQRAVKQGFLEGSNVNTVGSMVDMISIQRAYAAVQKAVQTVDGVDDLIANQLGKLA
jgi:flagellar basal-body rod protein FlgF